MANTEGNHSPAVQAYNFNDFVKWIKNQPNGAREQMREINDIMPKLPKNSWGAITNYIPNKLEIAEMRKVLPYNSKWHTIIKESDQSFIDGKRIWKKRPEQMT